MDKPEFSNPRTGKAGSGIFNSSTLMVPGSVHASVSASNNPVSDEKGGDSRTSIHRRSNILTGKLLKDMSVTHESNGRVLDPSTSADQDSVTEGGVVKKSGGPKRKGDLEFQMQLEMALSATRTESSERIMNLNGAYVDNRPSKSSPFKKLKAVGTDESPVSTSGMSTAVGSKKVGAPLYWAEVYCTGENSNGNWVHVDAVNAIIDGEQKVEAATAACKKSLRYVVAFAGHGAKDVTRRFGVLQLFH